MKLITIIFAGIEISDVLKIDDKDYSITFSLYFNVQWSEPRLNLSKTFFNSENITSDDHLVPGRKKLSASTLNSVKCTVCTEFGLKVLQEVILIVLNCSACSCCVLPGSCLAQYAHFSAGI